MTYFIFDMDCTIANLDSIYKLEPIYSLISLNKNPQYEYFVEGVLNEERKETAPLGILRPGILQVMSELNNLKKQGKIKGVIIYSNNGHLKSLEFIKDLIHKYLKTNDLIKDCIHWYHPMRNIDKNNQDFANKKWDEIANIIKNGKCQEEKSLSPKDIYFFDDLDHTDLHKHLQDNYYKVPPYKYKTPLNRIEKIYEKALINSSEDDVYNTANKLVEAQKKIIPITENSRSDVDKGIEMMFEAIDRVRNKTEGGKRPRDTTKATKGTKLRKVRKTRKSKKSKKNT